MLNLGLWVYLILGVWQASKKKRVLFPIKSAAKHYFFYGCRVYFHSNGNIFVTHIKLLTTNNIYFCEKLFYGFLYSFIFTYFLFLCSATTLQIGLVRPSIICDRICVYLPWFWILFQKNKYMLHWALQRLSLTLLDVFIDNTLVKHKYNTKKI